MFHFVLSDKTRQDHFFVIQHNCDEIGLRYIYINWRVTWILFGSGMASSENDIQLMCTYHTISKFPLKWTVSLPPTWCFWLAIDVFLYCDGILNVLMSLQLLLTNIIFGEVSSSSKNDIQVISQQQSLRHQYQSIERDLERLRNWCLVMFCNHLNRLLCSTFISIERLIVMFCNHLASNNVPRSQWKLSYQKLILNIWVKRESKKVSLGQTLTHPHVKLKSLFLYFT